MLTDFVYWQLAQLVEKAISTMSHGRHGEKRKQYLFGDVLPQEQLQSKNNEEFAGPDLRLLPCLAGKRRNEFRKQQSQYFRVDRNDVISCSHIRGEKHSRGRPPPRNI